MSYSPSDIRSAMDKSFHYKLSSFTSGANTYLCTLSDIGYYNIAIRNTSTDGSAIGFVIEFEILSKTIIKIRAYNASSTATGFSYLLDSSGNLFVNVTGGSSISGTTYLDVEYGFGEPAISSDVIATGTFTVGTFNKTEYCASVNIPSESEISLATSKIGTATVGSMTVTNIKVTNGSTIDANTFLVTDVNVDGTLTAAKIKATNMIAEAIQIGNWKITPENASTAIISYSPLES